MNAGGQSRVPTPDHDLGGHASRENSDGNEEEDEPDPGSLSASRAEQSVPSDDEDNEDDGDQDVENLDMRPNTVPSADFSRCRSHLPHLQIAEKFAQMVSEAHLIDERVSDDVKHRLQHPVEGPVEIDEDTRMWLEIYLAFDNASRDTYDKIYEALKRRFPEHDAYSWDRIKRKTGEISGVVDVADDVCVNSCTAYTGPYEGEQSCPYCGEKRYDQVKLEQSGGRIRQPRQQMHTILPGPQIQAMRRSKATALELRCRDSAVKQAWNSIVADGEVAAYEDFIHGTQFLETWLTPGMIEAGDTLLLISMDGAQLYRHKKSDVWIYIWVFMDLHLGLCFKKKYVMPGAFYPGPNPPKCYESILYTGLRHLQALVNDKFMVWDASTQKVEPDRPFLMFVTADGPGLSSIAGLVGHSGKFGDRLYCPNTGRHKPGAPTYYPMHSKPDNYNVSGCDHPDVNVFQIPPPSHERYEANLSWLLDSKTEEEYRLRRLATGIVRPSIISGVQRRFCIPYCYTGDVMHYFFLNQPDLMLGLWRGTIKAAATDNPEDWRWCCMPPDIWKERGELMPKFAPYLPCCMDVAPRNPAEKISSGYKAKEHQIYFFGYGPAVFRLDLPDPFFDNIAMHILAARLTNQKRITPSQAELIRKLEAHFVQDFETLYVERRADRMHFCRHSIHGNLHHGAETTRLGPLRNLAQWLMERLIGNLGQEVKQPSNPFQNMSQRGLRRAQVNAVKGLVDLEPDKIRDPKLCRILGDGYTLLHPRASKAVKVPPKESRAIAEYMEEHYQEGRRWVSPVIQKWARLELPNEHIARSLWNEGNKAIEDVRMSRNVKVSIWIMTQGLYDTHHILR